MLVQAEALKINKPLMVVGTPGRLTELSRMGRLQIHHCHTLILDEVITIAPYSLVIFHDLAPACINLFCMHALTFFACMHRPSLHLWHEHNIKLIVSNMGKTSQTDQEWCSER